MSRTVKIKNNTLSTGTWVGAEIAPATYLILETIKVASWASDNKVLTDIGNGDLVVNDGSDDITDISDAIDYLKGNLAQDVSITAQQAFEPPFAAKTLPDGSKLFRRKYGVVMTVPANSSNEAKLTVPHTNAKFNEIEVIGGVVGDTVDLSVNDTVEGLIQQSMGVPAEDITPHGPLNQFGFDVAIAPGLYKDSSRYDADVIAGMEIVLMYHNNNSEPVTVGVNWTLHEVRPSS